MHVRSKRDEIKTQKKSLLQKSSRSRFVEIMLKDMSFTIQNNFNEFFFVFCFQRMTESKILSKSKEKQKTRIAENMLVSVYA